MQPLGDGVMSCIPAHADRCEMLCMCALLAGVKLA